MQDFSLQHISTREEMIRFLDGYAAERMEELDARKLKRPVAKTHMWELLNGSRTCTTDRLSSILARQSLHLKPIDDTLYRVSGPQQDVGFLERLTPRIVAVYSTLPSAQLLRLSRRVVASTPDIDHVWLSGLTFDVLWGLVAKLSHPSRFTRLAFTHDSIFSIDDHTADGEEDEDSESEDSRDGDFEQVVERRATRFGLVDRVGLVQEKLVQLQHLYGPFNAISQLRFPSPVSRGGHDFWHDGRVTNKSASFRDHRSHVLYVVRIYEKLLRSTEEQAWYSVMDSIGVPGQFRKIVGAPVVISFSERLPQEVFDHWILATFGRRLNRFRLWGHPIRLGPTKVHVYGVDRHLYQPLFLELTSTGCTAIVPNGTCGNTVHRLVTNIQRYLDPAASAFIGTKRYRDVVSESAQGIPYEPSAQ